MGMHGWREETSEGRVLEYAVPEKPKAPRKPEPWGQWLLLWVLCVMTFGVFPEHGNKAEMGWMFVMASIYLAVSMLLRKDVGWISGWVHLLLASLAFAMSLSVLIV